MTASDESRFSGLNKSGRVASSSGRPAQTERGLPAIGPVTLEGGIELIQDGFDPIESLTGSDWIATVWPEEHRRSLPETRVELLNPGADEVVWFVRSPWHGISTTDALSLVWANLGRDESMWPAEADAILHWPASHAAAEAATMPE
jgi:hypothetical protein